MAFDFKNEIKRIPREPGVYLMKSADNEIIYVGKPVISIVEEAISFLRAIIEWPLF